MTVAVYHFCARVAGNMPSFTEKSDNGLCESRRVTSELAYAVRGDEIHCRGCGLITVQTFGLVGHGILGKDNVMRPHTLYKPIS